MNFLDKLSNRSKKKEEDRGFGISNSEYNVLKDTGILKKFTLYLINNRALKYSELINANEGFEKLTGELRGIESCMKAFEGMNRYYNKIHKEKNDGKTN